MSLLQNITGALPRKLKRKISWALSYKILPPEITKTWEIAIFGGTLGAWEPMWNSMFFMILWISESFSLYLLIKNSFNFKLGFFIYLEYISGGIIRKNILHSDYHSARWYWCKKTRKTFHKLHIKFFLNSLFMNSSLSSAFLVQNFCKNSFSGGKSRTNDIPVIKNHLCFAKNPPELQVSMS